MRRFYNVLVNTLIANVTTSFLWFALTFWIYLETQSVLATAIVGGAYMFMIAILSLVFGTLVDHHRKKSIMLLSSVITLVAYVIAGILFLIFPESSLTTLNSPIFWSFGLVILIGAVVENMRNIALATTVTILVPKDDHAKANGMVGTVQGLAFLVTSVFSGLSIGYLGMGWTLAIAVLLTGIALAHLFFVQIPEEEIVHDPELANKKIDLKGSIAAIRAVPGLGAMIIFTTFNNFVGGVYMALMDPYGLTLFSVQVWGIVLGVTSTGFIVGGILVAKFGLGKKPLKTLLLANIVVGLVGMLFAIREFWLLYAAGIWLYMVLMPMIEAAEQTVIQRVIPLKRQGRVFGFAQSVEALASPISAFLIGPIAQFLVIPYTRSAEGQAQLNWLLGEGQARGIALIFLITGVIVMLAAIFAFRTKAYVYLSTIFKKA